MKRKEKKGEKKGKRKGSGFGFRCPWGPQGEPAPADTKSWYEHISKTQQETPGRLEEAAKFLSGVISITLTLLLTVGKGLR